MRDIKFRARSLTKYPRKNIAFGDWVYGSYIESGTDAPCIIFDDGEQCEIDRKTLGQLTGLEDKNGKEIYEGDIVSYGHFALNDTEKYGEKCWDNLPEGITKDDISTVRSTYKIDGTISNLYKLDLDIKHNPDVMGIEVIGNIYENSDLLNE